MFFSIMIKPIPICLVLPMNHKSILMNKSILILLFAFIYTSTFQAQDFQGKAFYQSKTSIDFDFDSRQIPADRKKRIMERMKSELEKTYELSFDRTASLYIEEKKLEQPSANGNGRGGFRGGFGAGETGNYYKNIQTKTYTNETELFGKKFLIKDSLPTWEWVLSSETKKIGNYTVYKATATKAIDTTMSSIFRRGPGRSGGPRGNRPDSDQEKSKDSIQKDTVNTSLLSRIKKSKETTITVWYTQEIPISQGPSDYWGLPGLVLEANNGRTALLCTKIVLNSEEKISIEAPKKGKEITQAEYDKLRIEKVKEMSERFRGGNRGGGNRGGFRN